MRSVPLPRGTRVTCLAILSILAVSGCTNAPTTPRAVPAPDAPAPAPAAPAAMAGNVARGPLPTGDPGRSVSVPDEIVPSVKKPEQDQRGAFRVVCAFSHMSYDDPIVHPGRPGASHLHAFFGNTGADASSTAASLLNSGNSTCKGGIANRSAYWVPAVIDTASRQAIEPNFFITYYKAGFNPEISNDDIQPVPDGLRMVSGATDFTSTDPLAGIAQFAPERGRVKFYCKPSGASTNSIPDCPGDTELTLQVFFPQCWNGRDLDSPDHRSHLSWSDNKIGCPSTHPVVLPEITLNVRYPIPAGTNPRTAWRLSSDMYAPGTPGGFSAHGDLFAAWDMDVQRQWLDRCVHNGNSCG